MTGISDTVRIGGLFAPVKPDGLDTCYIDWNVPVGAEVKAIPSFCCKGVWLSKTWAGAARCGYPTIRCATVSFDPADIIDEDEDKVCVSKATVTGWFDAVEWICSGVCAGANLTGASLSRADLAGADLAHTDLRRADLLQASLVGADLTGANLAGAILIGADLADADLADANFSKANLTEANFTRASLINANLYGADMANANLTHANLTGANLKGALVGEWPRGFDGYAQWIE